MGTWYKIVNPAKRQYLEIADFNENIKWSGLITGGGYGQSFHAIAIAWLVCRSERGTSVVSWDKVGGS